MTISEGELLAIDSQTPTMGWDSRPKTGTGKRQRWITDGLHRRLVVDDAEEQFLRNDILDSQPPYGQGLLPGDPAGDDATNPPWNWTLLQRIPLA